LPLSYFCVLHVIKRHVAVSGRMDENEAKSTCAAAHPHRLEIQPRHLSLVCLKRQLGTFTAIFLPRVPPVVYTRPQLNTPVPNSSVSTLQFCIDCYKREPPTYVQNSEESHKCTSALFSSNPGSPPLPLAQSLRSWQGNEGTACLVLEAHQAGQVSCMAPSSLAAVRQ